MKTPERWKLIPVIFVVNIAITFVLAILDWIQIQTFFKINTSEAWDLYAMTTMPAIWKMWLLVFVAMGIVWYITQKDVTESLGIALSGMIMVSTGLEDLFYFILSPQTLQPCMAYLNDLGFLNIASRLLGEECVSGGALILNATGGLIFAGLVLYGLTIIDNYLPQMKWVKR